MITATYSPEDNKLRLYSSERLDSETFAQVKTEGFRWAPKQELFVAPMWTPSRADLAEQLAGSIEDEDQSLVERSEIRAERFENYSDKRAADSSRAADEVDQLTEHIPLGQPVLVGHHSEKAARKQAQKIESAQARAVKMWETSEYWTYRAAGAIRSAKYKERPDVRTRRIKKIQADKRKQERTRADAVKMLAYWQKFGLERAKDLANIDSIHLPDGDRRGWSVWSALDKGNMTPAEAVAIAEPIKHRIIAFCDRWLSHYDNRLIYELAMLEAQGGSDLLKPKARPKKPPILNYKTPEGFLMIKGRWDDEPVKYKQEERTRAEYAKIYKDYKGTEMLNGHRVRVAYLGSVMERRVVCIFITDSKAHKRPEA